VIAVKVTLASEASQHPLLYGSVLLAAIGGGLILHGTGKSKFVGACLLLACAGYTFVVVSYVY
jgi:hypothetical protein